MHNPQLTISCLCKECNSFSPYMLLKQILYFFFKIAFLYIIQKHPQETFLSLFLFVFLLDFFHSLIGVR